MDYNNDQPHQSQDHLSTNDESFSDFPELPEFLRREPEAPTIGEQVEEVVEEAAASSPSERDIAAEAEAEAAEAAEWRARQPVEEIPPLEAEAAAEATNDSPPQTEPPAKDAPPEQVELFTKVPPQWWRPYAPRMLNAVAHVLENLDGEWLVLPLKAGTAEPSCDDWAALQLSRSNVAQYFAPDSNIAAELGKRSWGLTVLHLGNEIAARVAESLAPFCGSRMSQEGAKHSSHLLYSTALAWEEPAIDSTKYIDPVDNEVLVEINVGGGEPAFVVMPPSVVDGVRWQWDQAEHELYMSSKVKGATLIEAAKLIGFVSLLAKHWPAPDKAKAEAVEAAEKEVAAAQAALSAVIEKPVKALILAMDDGATEEQKEAARAAYDKVKNTICAAQNTLEEARRKLADAQNELRTAKLRKDRFIARGIGGFLHHAGILPGDAKRLLRYISSPVGNLQTDFDDCVGGADRYNIPGMSHEAAQKKLARTPGLAPLFIIHGTFGRKVADRVKEWFGYDENRERAESPSNDNKPKGPFIKTSAEFSTFIPPDYLVDGLMVRGFFYSCTALTGGGKTAFAVMLAAHVALGRRCGDMQITEPARVLYFAGENAMDVKMRWVALCSELGVEAGQVDVRFVDRVLKFSEATAAITAEVGADCYGLIVVDTSAAYIEGDDENSNVQLLAHAKRLRALTELPGNPTVLVLTHPTKNAAADNLTPRGGGAFLNETDGNLTLKNDDGTIELHWQGKLRGPDFDPKHYRLRTVTNPRLVDKKGRLLPTVLAEPVSLEALSAQAQQSRSDEDLLLITLKTAPGRSGAEYARDLGWGSDRRRVSRTLKKLVADKLVERHRGKFRLTPKGAKEVGNE